jgi:alpha-glucosidase (family GH31 glycosyl hydrolase)
MDMQYSAVCKLNWRRAREETLATRQFWLPPGVWIDAWNGQRQSGPKTVDMQLPLARIPLMIRAGAIVPLAPTMQYTGEKPWDPITLDVYPAPAANSQNTLYEDDGISNQYKTGACRKTRLTASADDGMKTLQVKISSADGTFDGARGDRAWKLRVHLSAGSHATKVQVDGQAAQTAETAPQQSAMPFTTTGAAADSPVLEVDVPSKPVSQARQIVIEF